jgi:hypothetical protein
MGIDEEFAEIDLQATAVVPRGAQISQGIPIPPLRLLQVMSPQDWGNFTDEGLISFDQRL